MEYRQLPQEEYADLSSRILYEDNHLLVVDKKAGEITQGDKTGDEPLPEKYKALIAMRDSKPGKVFLGVPHRLDRPVCGICILAKTSKALERLTAMFRDGQVHKTYWALCCNRPDRDEALLEDYLIRNEKQNKTYIARRGQSAPGAKLAIKGDLKYGAPRSNPDGGICLQAHGISFVHPVRKTPLDISAGTPDWKGL